MLDLSEKLKKFSMEVLGTANENSQRQWEDFIEQQKKEYDRKETEYLESGYNMIQQGLKKIDKEKSSRLSKAVMESRQQVLQKRVEIIEQVFTELQKRLLEYTKSEEYRRLLQKRVNQTIDMLGEGEKKIILTAADMDRIDQKAFAGKQVQFEAEKRMAKGGMIGGARGYHLEKNIFYDNSFAGQVEKKKEDFLQEMATELQVES